MHRTPILLLSVVQLIDDSSSHLHTTVHQKSLACCMHDITSRGLCNHIVHQTFQGCLGWPSSSSKYAVRPEIGAQVQLPIGLRTIFLFSLPWPVGHSFSFHSSFILFSYFHIPSFPCPT